MSISTGRNAISHHVKRMGLFNRAQHTLASNAFLLSQNFAQHDEQTSIEQVLSFCSQSIGQMQGATQRFRQFLSMFNSTA